MGPLDNAAFEPDTALDERLKYAYGCGTEDTRPLPDQAVCMANQKSAAKARHKKPPPMHPEAEEMMAYFTGRTEEEISK